MNLLKVWIFPRVKRWLIFMSTPKLQNLKNEWDHQREVCLSCTTTLGIHRSPFRYCNISSRLISFPLCSCAVGGPSCELPFHGSWNSRFRDDDFTLSSSELGQARVGLGGVAKFTMRLIGGTGSADLAQLQQLQADADWLGNWRPVSRD